jgi:beta-xylosidase
MTEARKLFGELTQRAQQIPDAELDEFWASLEPATIADMIGEWQGGEFVTGHMMNGGLAKAKWFGKTFTSAADVKPLVCLDDDGNKFSNVEMGKGEASLWLEEFRGEVTATMVYDGQPIHDHFKKIDDGAVMGIMNGKHVLDAGRYFYFYLERV